MAAQLRGTLLSSHVGHSLVLECLSCGRTLRLDIRKLLERTPDGLVGDFVMKARCAECGQMPWSIRLELSGRSMSVWGPPLDRVRW